MRERRSWFPSVDELSEEATSTLLGVFAQLSRSRHEGLAQWSTAVSEALLVRLVTVSTGVDVDGAAAEPRALSTLDLAELDGLRALMDAGAQAGDDPSVIDWCARMAGLIRADLFRRELDQAAIDAKAAAIIAEERKLACGNRRDGLFTGLRP